MIITPTIQQIRLVLDEMERLGTPQWRQQHYFETALAERRSTTSRMMQERKHHETD